MPAPEIPPFPLSKEQVNDILPSVVFETTDGPFLVYIASLVHRQDAGSNLLFRLIKGGHLNYASKVLPPGDVIQLDPAVLVLIALHLATPDTPPFEELAEAVEGVDSDL